MTYYKKKIDDIRRLYESQKAISRMFVPKYDQLLKIINIEDYFDQTEFDENNGL
jgi:hypothetical protein